MYHPEKYLCRQDKYERKAHKRLKKLLGDRKIDSIEIAKELVKQLTDDGYLLEAITYASKITRKKPTGKEGNPYENFFDDASDEEIEKFSSIADAAYKAIVDEIQLHEEEIGPDVVSKVVKAIKDDKEKIHPTGCNLLALLASRSVPRLHHSLNGKLYITSKDLSDRFVQTHLRNVMAEHVQLPAESIYVVMPENPPRKITRRRVTRDGTMKEEIYDLEGMYLTLVINRDGKRFISCAVTARGKETIKSISTLVLSDGKTIEECFDQSLKLVMDKYSDERHRYIGLQSHKVLVECFRFVMNVCIYVTVPDADISTLNSNPEFQKLWTRAQKTKGKKRKELFRKANENKGPSRILLGKSLVLSREEKEIADQIRRGEGTAHRVRTYVQGHWQRYWIKDPDNENQKIRRWTFKKAFWKGDEGLPISNKTHILR